MAPDFSCPYCGKEQDISSDAAGRREDEIRHEQTCCECGKNFVYTVETHYTYGVTKADCLNGGAHVMLHFPYSSYPDHACCADCGYEEYGAYARLCRTAT